MTLPLVKIYGERNTGTNYFQELLRANLPVQLLHGQIPRKLLGLTNRVAKVSSRLGLINDTDIHELNLGLFSESIIDLYFKHTFHHNLGWKHAFVNHDQYRNIFENKKILFITITKNPYSWLLSLYRRPYHCLDYDSLSSATFLQFLQTEWKPWQRENYQGTFLNPIMIWNKKNESYLNLKEVRHTLNLKYESILSDPQKIVDLVAKELSVDPPKQFFNINDSSKQDKGKNFSYYQHYYLSEQWRQLLCKNSIDYINHYLDKNLMNHFQYEFIEETDNALSEISR